MKRAYHGVASKEELVEQVKSLQKSDAVGKERWSVYCDKYGSGSKDPNRHEPDFLQGFLTEYNSGSLEGLQSGGLASAFGGADSASDPLVSLIKTGQRNSASWKQSWVAFCQTYGNEVCDPAKHPHSFLTNFLDFVGQQALLALNGSGNQVMAPRRSAPVLALRQGGPPAKVARTAAWSGGGGGGAKAELVEKVKMLQKSSPEQKQLWADFCNERAQGVLDPNRHEQSSLEEFISYFAGQSFGHSRTSVANSGLAPSPELVDKIKAFCKASPEQKEQWKEFCNMRGGGTLDPNRHEQTLLEEFVTQYCY